jgi:hypothetical protein
LWNTALDGFGINDPGKGRQEQKPSDWDVLHPGRTYAAKLRGKATADEKIIAKIKNYFSSE